MTKQAEQIVDVLTQVVPEESAHLAGRVHPQALASAQAIRGEIVPRLEDNPAYAPLWQQFRAHPQAQAPVLVGIVQVLVQADPRLEARLEALLEQYRAASRPTGTEINTGGGAYVGGDVTVSGGDFVGRDRYNVHGDGNIIGDHGRVIHLNQQGADAVALAQAFGEIYARIQRDRQLTAGEQSAAMEEVTALQQAATAQGEELSEGFVRERLRNLQRMAPDILDVVLTTFANPVAGAGMVIKKIAEKMKADAT